MKRILLRHLSSRDRYATLCIKRQKVAGAFDNPKGIRLKW